MRSKTESGKDKDVVPGEGRGGGREKLAHGFGLRLFRMNGASWGSVI